MTLKDALWRELKYGLCGAGGALEGLVAADRVKLDMRLSPPSARDEADYPWLIFRRDTASENNQVQYARERFEIEVVGLRSSASKGDDRLEAIRTALLGHFVGTRKTIGKFDADGNADPSGGLRVGSVYVSTAEGFDADSHEKAHIHIFMFHLLRS